MLDVLAGYGVPLCLILLMLIVGTDVEKRHFIELTKAPRAVLLGSLGQLLAIPLVGLAVSGLVSPAPSVATGLLLLAICPGGGISNYYSYAAHANVALSATVTTLATLFSLLTIPVWLALLPVFDTGAVAGGALPLQTIVAGLFATMVLPIAAGLAVRYRWPDWTTANAPRLRTVSALVILLVLVLTAANLGAELLPVAGDIALAATAFILLAMAVGRVMGIGLRGEDRAVLVIESGVRNIPIALMMGRSIFAERDFAIFASFLTGYFLIELIIMLAYAAWTAAALQSEKASDPDAASRSAEI